MNAAEILANVVGVVAKAQDWSDEQKLQAASEILNVLKREGHLVLDPDEWEFVPSRAGGFLKGPFPWVTRIGRLQQAAKHSFDYLARPGRERQLEPF